MTVNGAAPPRSKSAPASATVTGGVTAGVAVTVVSQLEAVPAAAPTGPKKIAPATGAATLRTRPSYLWIVRMIFLKRFEAISIPA